MLDKLDAQAPDALLALIKMHAADPRDDKIDLGVGLTVQARIGDELHRNSPLATIHFNDSALFEEAAGLIRNAYEIGPARVEPPKLIKEVLR